MWVCRSPDNNSHVAKKGQVGVVNLPKRLDHGLPQITVFCVLVVCFFCYMMAAAVSRGCLRVSKLVLQVCHLLIGLILLCLGLAEFFMEPPLFDILGLKGRRPSLPAGAFPVNVSSTHLVFGRVMDLPVLSLFVAYFMTLVWLKFRGYLSWIMSGCLVLALFLLVAVNRGFASSKDLLQWRYMGSRTAIIVLDVLILSFGWTTVIMVLLLIRGWFPFKTMKSPPVTKTDKGIAIIGNIIGLYIVLNLCFFLWFTRLYVSWACIESYEDFLLLCQLTNMVQCYYCDDIKELACTDEVLAECVHNHQDEPFRCPSPYYTIKDYEHVHGFCVFNFNIGPFTFITVFAYTGAIYFFCRTIFKALLKCVKVVGLISLKYCYRVIRNCRKKTEVVVNDGGEDSSLSKDRMSLLASLPKDYAATGKVSSSKH